MNDAQVIRGALELLGDGENWTQDGWGRDGKYCVAHALSMSSRLQGGGSLAVGACDAALAEIGVVAARGWSYVQVGEWNDDPHTTFEDVRLVLKRALARAEADELP